MNKLQILFACEANLRGYQWKPVFQNESLIDRVLATRVSTAPIKTLLYSTSTLAVFMDIVEAYLLLERKMAADLILDFSRRYGPLKKVPQMTYLSDYWKLIEKISEEPDFVEETLTLNFRRNENGDPEIRPANLGDTLFLDFLSRGEPKRSRCEYFKRFGEMSAPAKGKTNCWLVSSHGSAIWCSNACRMAAKTREKGAKK